MRKLGFIFLIFFGMQIKAQDLTQTHYEIIGPKGTDISLYKKLIDGTYIDSLRFVHERRTIEFVNAPVKIILYSADELLLNTGKIISPFNIEDPSKARRIRFLVTENNVKFISIEK